MPQRQGEQAEQLPRAILAARLPLHSPESCIMILLILFYKGGLLKPAQRRRPPTDSLFFSSDISPSSCVSLCLSTSR